jgi:hypothetical protein
MEAKDESKESLLAEERKGDDQKTRIVELDPNEAEAPPYHASINLFVFIKILYVLFFVALRVYGSFAFSITSLVLLCSLSLALPPPPLFVIKLLSYLSFV